jgi:hypothetical protein
MDARTAGDGQLLAVASLCHGRGLGDPRSVAATATAEQPPRMKAPNTAVDELAAAPERHGRIRQAALGRPDA